MLKLIPYHERLDKEIERMDTKLFHALKVRPDIIPDSVFLVQNGSRLSAAGYLYAGASFLSLAEELPEYHLHLHYSCRGSRGTEAVLLLFQALKERFFRLQAEYPGKRLILRTWCPASHTAYQEMLASFGFRAMRIMQVMELKDLARFESLDEADPEAAAALEAEGIRFVQPDLRNEETQAAFLAANREAFVAADSIYEIIDMVKCGEAELFSLMKDGSFVNSVTVYRYKETVYATENIFCVPSKRRKGYTEYLLRQVLHELICRQADGVRLTVFGDDLPAILLYLKLGYEIADVMLEMHLEQDYEPAWY